MFIFYDRNVYKICLIWKLYWDPYAFVIVVVTFLYPRWVVTTDWFPAYIDDCLKLKQNVQTYLSEVEKESSLYWKDGRRYFPVRFQDTDIYFKYVNPNCLGGTEGGGGYNVPPLSVFWPLYFNG